MRIPLGLFAIALIGTPVLAEGPGALVTDVSGAVSPAVDLFDEVDVGTELRLDKGARLTLEHYISCEAVTMTGGSVAVRDRSLDVARADVAGRVEMPCAKAVTLRPQEVANAGVIVRGVGSPRVPLSPQIIVAGKGDGFETMRILRDGDVLWTLPVDEGRVAWPEGRLFLTDQSAYTLVLSGPAGERRVQVQADRSVGGRTVLRP